VVLGLPHHVTQLRQPHLAVGVDDPPGSSSPVAPTANYSANNRVNKPPSGLSITYDAAGDVTNDGYNTYLYDAEGRVCAVNGPQGKVGYLYDGDGHRVGKGSISLMSCDITQNNYTSMTDYILDSRGGQMTEVAIAGSTASWQHTNVTANGTLIATYDTVGLHFYLNDPLGSRRAQTDAAGFPEQTCQNLPFGDQLYCSGSLTSPTEHHFTGKERDQESGLDYFGARYMSSNMGRFMSPDPSQLFYADLSDPQSLNLYSYGRNNPLVNVDPTGLDCGHINNDTGAYQGTDTGD